MTTEYRDAVFNAAEEARMVREAMQYAQKLINTKSNARDISRQLDEMKIHLAQEKLYLARIRKWGGLK